MRADARVKWRFLRNAAVVSLRDDSEFRDYVVFRSGASLRDAIPSGFKIATAALRPRNDTNLKRFCFGNGRFSFYAAFLRGDAPHRFQTFRSENRLPGGCSCPESAAGRNKSAVRRKNTQPGKRKKPADILDFLNSLFYIVCVILFKILPSDSTRKSKFVCIFCGLTSKKKENILESTNRYIAYRTNEQEAEHHGSEYKFCGRPV